MDRKAKQSRSERVWRRRLSDQRASGLSAAAWCRKKGLPYSSFMCWKRRLRESDGALAPEQPLFQELVLAGPGPKSAPIEVCLPSGLSIRVPAGADRETLRLVLEVAARC